MYQKYINEYTCCFTGHRPEKLTMCENEIKELLNVAIENAISDGFTTFISGMSRGIDIWAAEIVLEKRKSNKKIRLICAVPYEGFESKWNVYDKEKYNGILMTSDHIEYVCTHYSKVCFQIRNAYMVDSSKRVIAVYNGGKGGTQNTIKYAKRKNTEVVNVLSLNKKQM